MEHIILTKLNKTMETKSITKQITQWNKISNYDKLFNVLIEWYNEKQIHEIWELMRKYDTNKKSTINSLIGLGKSKNK